MKRLIIAALAGSAALLAGTAANALTFTYTGHIDSYTVQTGGWYEIDAWGAQGGSWENSNSGGLGALVGGRIYLNAGQLLDIVVGSQGSSYYDSGSGGGGGSFVFIASNLDLLLAAGGGGGSGWLGAVGGPGLAGRDGGGAEGGVDGGGGNTFDGPTIYTRGSGGGAGWLGPGASGSALPGNPSPGLVTFGTGGSNAPTFYGGSSGGFGGGGGGSYNYGGGGGGYSGGGGRGGTGMPGGGGGGGSYIADSFYDFVGQSGVNAGNGLVTIDLLPIPEPATWAMMLLGFFGLGSVLRRRRLSPCSAEPLCSPHP